MFLSVYYAPMLISKAGVAQVYLPEAELTWSPCRASLELEWEVLPPSKAWGHGASLEVLPPWGQPAGQKSPWPAERTCNRYSRQVKMQLRSPSDGLKPDVL